MLGVFSASSSSLTHELITVFIIVYGRETSVDNKCLRCMLCVWLLCGCFWW
jgi:hypothetical protein